MENNVITLFNRRPAQEKDKGTAAAAPLVFPVAPTSEAPQSAGDFAAIAERNRVLQDKLRKEREQANKAVLKSYRIK
ncbi:MAG: hypothetical protein IOD12_07045 [Silvanigrellales bacterium]|nr:hypothetical protein [Silvanigrellales bacterium]